MTNNGSKLTKLFLPKKKGQRPIKRSLSGYEYEVFVLDSNGKIDNSDSLLKKARSKNISVKEECAKGILELVCLPHRRISSVNVSLINKFRVLYSLAEREGNIIYPFSTYPGINKPVFRDFPRYNVQRKIFGVKRWINSGMCSGFHQHYTLPKGTYNKRTKFLNYNVNSKVKRTLLDSYNLLNAIDPILTVFLQSSPFVNNKYLANDSRLLLQRGGRKLNYMGGLYSLHQFFGALSPYKHTIKDLIISTMNKDAKWKYLMKKHGANNNGSKNILDYSWNPVKINKIGTLEYRGGDTNLLSNIFAVSTMIKYALRKIQQEFTLVTPLDIKLKDSFKMENNMIFIPPQSTVRGILQKSSAYNGLKGKSMYKYASNFFKFIKKEVASEYKPFLRPIKKMLDKRETLSDEMRKKAKRDGFRGGLTDSYSKEFAIFYSQKFFNDLKLIEHPTRNMGD